MSLRVIMSSSRHAKAGRYSLCSLSDFDREKADAPVLLFMCDANLDSDL